MADVSSSHKDNSTRGGAQMGGSLPTSGALRRSSSADPNSIHIKPKTLNNFRRASSAEVKYTTKRSSTKGASPLRRATTLTSAFTSHSSNRFKDMDSSSSHSHSMGSSVSFGSVVAAARFTKKIGRKLSAMSDGSRNKDDNSSRRGESPRRDKRSAREKSSIIQDPHRHLQTRMTAETAPYLSQYIDHPIPAPSMARNSLLVGNLIQEGDFSHLTEVHGFKSRNPHQKQHPYAIKALHPRLFQPQRDEDSEAEYVNELERAVLRMVLEGLYLGHLDHPHIVKLRGVAMGGMASEPEALFLLTDRIGETLDQRLDTWKEIEMAREKEERRRQRREKLPPMVPNSMAKDTDLETMMRNKTIKSYPQDLIVLKTNYALQILDALQYLHARGIVVRELRPESIGFLDYPHHHTVQLCDLSSCKEMPRDGSAIAPEEIEHRPSMLDVTRMDHGSKNSDVLGVRVSVTARRYMAPEMFGEDGYDTKSDLYSWAMILSELVTETKPYSSRQLMRDWSKIVNGELRPKLQKYHFPRTLKAIMEQAWQADTRRRATAKQAFKSLTHTLHMLEGQGLKLTWTVDPQLDISKAAAEAGANGSSPQRRMTRQKTLTQQSMTKAATNAMRQSFHLHSTVTDEPLSLPQRAKKYKRLQAREPVGWGSVWDPQAGNKHTEDDQGMQKTLSFSTAKVFQKRYKDKARQITGM